jgi:hypothetical protein
MVMTTQALHQERRDDFQQLVRRWDRRLRLQQIFTWLPRCLLPGLLVGILIGVISRLRPWLLGTQILTVTGVLLVVGLVVMILAVGLWPRPLLAAARRFDVLFGLRERISTALELMDGRIHANDELTTLQVNDAWETAQSVQAGQQLATVWNRREWGIAVGLALLVVALALLPNPQAQAVVDKSAQETALESAREELQAITQEVAADPALNPEEREQLLEALQASSETLKEPDVTTEEAFAALSDAKAALENQASQMNEQQQAQQASLNAANESLKDFQTAEAAAQSQQTGQPQTQTIPLLNTLAQQLQNMTTEQQQALGQALQQAAQDLQQTNPQAAQALQQAAQQLQQGNQSAAQQALQQAAEQLQQDAQAAQNQQNSAQQLSQAAQDMQSTANEVSQQGEQNGQNQQGQQQQNQPSGQQGQQGQDGQQGQSAQQAQSQQGQQGQDGQQGQNGQQGQIGQQGQSGQAGQSALPAQGAQQGQQLGNAATSGANSSGAGDQQGGSGSEGTSGQQTGQVPQTNAPDGQGQGQFDSIYAPQRIGGSGGPEVQLDPNSSNSPVEEGNFSENPTGNVTVPYNQVFSDYSNAANQALQSDYIPLGLRDVVRDYFSSLEPGQGNGQSGNTNSPGR